jgi:hypothetical protein
MGEMGFFDAGQRYEGFDRNGGELPFIAELALSEEFRSRLKAARRANGLRKRAAERRSQAGRKPWTRR